MDSLVQVVSECVIAAVALLVTRRQVTVRLIVPTDGWGQGAKQVGSSFAEFFISPVMLSTEMCV